MSDKPNTELEDAVQAFVDGFLDEDDKLDMLDHLAANPDEAERVDAFLAQNNALRTLRRDLEVGDPTQFCPDLQARIVRRLDRGHRWRGYAAMAAAAAVAAVVAGSTAWYTLDRMPVAELTPEQEAVVAQLPPLDGPQFPFDSADRVVASAETQPFEWFNSHLTAGRSFRQPDFSGNGLNFYESRVLTEGPAPAIHVIYGDESGPDVHFYAGVLSLEMRAAFNLVPEGHLSLHWQSDNVMFAVIMPADRAPLMADLVQAVGSAFQRDDLNQMMAGEDASTAPPVEIVAGDLASDVSSETGGPTPLAQQPVAGSDTTIPVLPQDADGQELIVEGKTEPL